MKGNLKTIFSLVKIKKYQLTREQSRLDQVKVFQLFFHIPLNINLILIHDEVLYSMNKSY